MKIFNVILTHTFDYFNVTFQFPIHTYTQTMFININYCTYTYTFSALILYKISLHTYILVISAKSQLIDF